ncbi:ABC multidrug transporter [Aspergillus sclerotialis]|uniref:ABC multidrug transporter n=1 Tax=Aspergillus sclerotialis TaxID=2070753 RepID=A0A3A2ZUI6_9EURO|nr:ABC multidrug transporter [Aspergillus sclerotialis]
MDHRCCGIEDLQEKLAMSATAASARIESDTLNINQSIAYMKEANLAFSEGSSSVLSDITVSVPRSKLTIVLGPVASGKSAFLKALLGEMHLTSRQVSTDFLFSAYCDQTSWLHNGTIRENIVGCSAAAFDENWYSKILWACDLEHDLT